LALSGASTYSGATTVNAGALVGVTSGSIVSAITVASGATNGVRVATGGGQWSSGALTYDSGTTYADFNFGAQVASASTAPMQVNGNVAFNGTLNVIVRNGVFAPGTYPLLKYTGTLSGTPPATVFSLPAGMSAALVNNTGNKSIDLNVTVGNVLAWGVGNGLWDINTTANWINNATPVVYNDGQAVTFDDTASGTSPITVTLNTNVAPAAVAVSNPTKDYTLTGSGSIAGATTLTKQGGGTLTLATANAHTGGVVLNDGRLNLGHASALGTAPGALTIGGVSQLDNTSGGPLTNAASNPQNWNADFTFLGSSDLNLGGGVVTLGGNRQVTVNAGTLGLGARISGAGYALTKAGPGTLSLANYTGSTLGSGTNLIINGGAVSFTGNYFGGSPFGYQALNALVNSGGTLRIGFPHALGGQNVSGSGTSWGQVILAGGTLDLAFEQYLPEGTVNGQGRLVLDGGSVTGLMDLRITPPLATISTLTSSVPSVIGNAGGLSLTFGSLDLDVPRGSAPVDLVISKVVSSAGSPNALTKNGNGIVWVTGTNTFSGTTTVSAGTLGITTAHAGAGSFDVADGATLVVSNSNNGASAQMNTLNLGGSGTATLEFAHVASTTIPVINVPGGVTVNGANTIKIADATGLTATGIYPLVACGAGLSGSVPALAPLPSGVVATLTNDTANAWIALDVTAVPPTVNPNPTNITLTVSGSDLVLNWPASHTGWVLQSQTNSRSLGLTTNGWFDVPGSATTNQVTVTPNKADPTVFYRLRLP
jgi:fibronectin-binding autotransporter adhesin